jgi:hypothetical protein
MTHQHRVVLLAGANWAAPLFLCLSGIQIKRNINNKLGNKETLKIGNKSTLNEKYVSYLK